MKILQEWKLCATAYAVIGTVALSGCVSTQPGAFEFATASGRNKQLGLTALMMADTAQTVTIARSAGCLHEADPIAAAVFGSEHPSTQRVLLTNGLYIGLHWLLGSWLDRKAERSVDFSIDAQADVKRQENWRAARTAYQLLTFVGHGAAVASNANRGIKPLSSFDCK